MQHKAPIRSQMLGPAMPGNISIQSIGQRKGIMFTNPSMSQIGLMFLNIMN